MVFFVWIGREQRIYGTQPRTYVATIQTNHYSTVFLWTLIMPSLLQLIVIVDPLKYRCGICSFNAMNWSCF